MPFIYLLSYLISTVVGVDVVLKISGGWVRFAMMSFSLKSLECLPFVGQK